MFAMSEDMNNSYKEVDEESKTELFVKLLSANYYRIGAFVQSQLYNNQDTDDVMQETSRMMWKKFDEFKPGTDFLAWAFAIAKYRILDFRKTRKGKNISLSNQTLELIEVESKKIMNESKDRLNALKECMQKLTKQDRKLLEMRFSYGLAAKYIAARIGTSIHVVYRNTSRIKSILLNCINRKMRLNRI